MKRWIAVLVILCISISIVVLSSCQKQQVEKQETETMGESMEAAPDTAAAMDTSAVEMEEPMGEMTE
jgi:hypothetical protein